MSESKYDPNEIADEEMREFVEKSRAHAEALGIPREEPHTTPEELDIEKRMADVRERMAKIGGEK